MVRAVPEATDMAALAGEEEDIPKPPTYLSHQEQVFRIQSVQGERQILRVATRISVIPHRIVRASPAQPSSLVRSEAQQE